jgi:hypothetical protein
VVCVEGTARSGHAGAGDGDERRLGDPEHLARAGLVPLVAVPLVGLVNRLDRRIRVGRQREVQAGDAAGEPLDVRARVGGQARAVEGLVVGVDPVVADPDDHVGSSLALRGGGLDGVVELRGIVGEVDLGP